MTDKSIAQVLRDAAELIEPEGAWTQKADARDTEETPVEPTSARAVCWCLDGAYEAVGGRWGDKGWLYLKLAIGEGPISWNDEPRRTQSEAVKAFREAAALAEEQAL